MRIDEAKRHLTDAVWFARHAYNESEKEEDITYIRALLDDVIWLVQRVLDEMDGGELISEMVANERFHPRPIRSE
jgi:hypothetical protein